MTRDPIFVIAYPPLADASSKITLLGDWTNFDIVPMHSYRYSCTYTNLWLLDKVGYTIFSNVMEGRGDFLDQFSEL